MEEYLIHGGREQQNLITCHPYASDGKHRKNTFHKPDAIAHLAFFSSIKEENHKYRPEKDLLRRFPERLRKDYVSGVRIRNREPVQSICPAFLSLLISADMALRSTPR